MPATAACEESAKKEPELLDALSNGLALLRLFGQGVPAMTMQQVAEELGVTRAAARRLLLTLQHHGYVAQDARRFSITPRVLELGHAYFASMSLPVLAQPVMQALAQELQETCSLGVLDQDAVVLLAREEPRKLLRVDLGVGRQLPAYAHSMGRVLLAALDGPALSAYFGRASLLPLTPATTTDPAALQAILQRAGKDGYCVLDSEMADGFGGLSVPLRDSQSRVVAALGLSMVLGRRTRKDLVRDCLPALQRAAQRIEAILGARSAGPQV
ncbi:IclR family transcriptional regulator [Acidovorax sp. SRB_14]|uniref:IclR family transcriptional regulator domain-containing protein n=1 Tax=unclassified Acidovorax TaxID=2684926 RepID=UPI00145F0DF3|nr:MULTISPECIES: IclR family transcriptional regulator C-terminal domain-containing protein [unclassified Acidovorax]NMM77327.1 IclR family transcriptional regulator [Acidovorax sp. SRB_24]NMM82134.1 IclR family transcriptional regulator [Acidovorax sp. SRB_14]